MNKYNAKKLTIDGIKFDSKKEANRYQELKLLERAGEISGINIHPKFRLSDGFDWNGKHYRPIDYYADFSYHDLDTGKVVIEDVKGVKTTVFRLKMKLLLQRLDEKLYEFRIV